MKNWMWVLIAVVVAVGLYAVVVKFTPPAKLDEFAKCLKEKGATFYGAFWCPHCQSQKKLFGRSEKYLPYVECSTADGRGQTAICLDKKIEGYPTWEYSDGTRESGKVELSELAAKTSCVLPSL